MKVIIVIVCIAVALPLVGWLWLQIVLSGGVRGFIYNLKSAPDVNSTAIARKRDAAHQSLVASFDELGTATQLTYYASSITDHCKKGQNNWKVHEGYANRCVLRETRFYGFDGDFRQQMMNLEQRLQAQGWRTDEWKSIERMITHYYDGSYGGPCPWDLTRKYIVSDLPKPFGIAKAAKN